MTGRAFWPLLALLMLLRVVTLGWDSGLVSPHPDERQVAFTAERLAGWLDDPGFYAYGSLHLEAVRAAARVCGLALDFRGLVLGGRALSAVASLATLLLAAFLAAHAWGRRAARLTALLLAATPLAIEQAHFCTVEAHHALWVLAALAAAAWLAERQTALPAAAVGLAFGASLAVKVASLPLAAALAVALLLVGRRRSRLSAVRLGAIAAAVTAAAFWAGQPSALSGAVPPFALVALLLVVALCVGGAERTRQAWPALVSAALAGLAVVVVAAATLAPVFGLEGARGPFVPALSAAFVDGVGAEIAMVTGAADLAYTRVYRATTPVVYPLLELGLWGLGVGLLLAVLVGVGLAGWRLAVRVARGRTVGWGRSPALLAILLAWLLPTALRLATLEVKFLRYWTPSLAPAVLVAAWVLTRCFRRRRLVVEVVVGLTIAGALAYLAGFTEPHPHRVAAEWLRPLLRPGEVVAFEHWDEGLALDVDGVESLRLPSYDLPDDRAKAQRWCEILARADWVVLTSNRIRRTVLANPHRFPLTARLYAELLEGRLGFLPLTRIDRGPHLLGLELPVQLADESFVNYDFPRVVILRRVAESAPAELVEAALAGPRPPSFAALERGRIESLPRARSRPTVTAELAAVVSWALLFAALALALWAILLPLCRAWPDAGLGLAAVAGWAVPAWVVWLGSRLGLWRPGPGAVTAVVTALFALGAVVGWRRRALLVSIWRRCRRALIAVALVVTAVALLFLLARAANPAIYWGEKPMDLSFLNAFVDASQWPPGEPWMAGRSLHYYYFGEVLAALPILATGVRTAIGYNLVAATIPALLTAALASLGLLAGRRARPLLAAGLAPLLVVLSGNLAWPMLLDLARQGRLFDLWWATSRVIPGFAIDEYPLFTTLFADLHAHFLAFPLVVAALAWGVVGLAARGRRALVALALCGLHTGLLAATNPWDLPIVSGLLVAAVLLGRRRLAAAARLALAAGLSLVAITPFVTEAAAWLAAGGGGRRLFLNSEGFASWGDLVRHFGLFLVPLVVAAVLALGRWLGVALVLAGVGVWAGATLGSSSAALALGLASLFLVAAGRAPRGALRLGWGAATVAMLAVAACERFTLADRMNTLFKTYNGAWIALALALAVVLLRSSSGIRRWLLAVWIPLELVALLNLPLGLVQAWLQPRVASPRPTLDGEAYLVGHDPEGAFVARLLTAAARPGEVVAEAAGPPYREYARVAMHTGLPTVVGWPYHLEQRGQERAEVERRYADLELLYGDTPPLVKRRLLDRYRVRWVVVASLERATYAITVDDPFAGVPGVVPIASRGAVTVYRVLEAAVR